MRRLTVVALLESIALAGIGTLLMYAAGESLLPASLPAFASPFMLLGTLFLLGGAYFGGSLLTVDDEGSRKRLKVVTSLGVLIIVLAPFTPFPVGCNTQTWFNPHPNIQHGCPVSPIGSWETVWPNILLLDLGLVFAPIGLSSRPHRSPTVGAGMGLIMGGLILIALGNSFGYITMCPENGCQNLTPANLWWPNVLAHVIGAGQIIAGSMACFIVWSKARGLLSAATGIHVS